MLTLQFIPYREIEQLDSNKRISKLLKIVQDEKIALLQGRLKKTEEAELIRRTMEAVDSKFKGIELSVVYPESKDVAFINKLREKFISLILGNRQGFTIIGPANIIKEIKQDPDKIQLLTQDKKRKRK